MAITFMSMAIECNGALSQQFTQVLNLSCEKRSEITGGNKSTLMQNWYRRISCTLHKGNSRAIAKRILDITQNNAPASDINVQCTLHDAHCIHHIYDK
jgi:hypothetical protein